MKYPVKNTSIYDMLDFNDSNLNGYEDNFLFSSGINLKLQVNYLK